MSFKDRRWKPRWKSFRHVDVANIDIPIENERQVNESYAMKIAKRTNPVNIARNVRTMGYIGRGVNVTDIHRLLDESSIRGKVAQTGLLYTPYDDSFCPPLRDYTILDHTILGFLFASRLGDNLQPEHLAAIGIHDFPNILKHDTEPILEFVTKKDTHERVLDELQEPHAKELCERLGTNPDRVEDVLTDKEEYGLIDSLENLTQANEYQSIGRFFVEPDAMLRLFQHGIEITSDGKIELHGKVPIVWYKLKRDEYGNVKGGYWVRGTIKTKYLPVLLYGQRMYYLDPSNKGPKIQALLNQALGIMLGSDIDNPFVLESELLHQEGDRHFISMLEENQNKDPLVNAALRYARGEATIDELVVLATSYHQVVTSPFKERWKQLSDPQRKYSLVAKIVEGIHQTFPSIPRRHILVNVRYGETPSLSKFGDLRDVTPRAEGSIAVYLRSGDYKNLVATYGHSVLVDMLSSTKLSVIRTQNLLA